MTRKNSRHSRPSRASHQGLRDMAERIAGDEDTGPSEAEQLDLLRLAHELELARVELEAQNDELRKRSRELEAARSEFWDLYEFAPVAFVTLSHKGIVQQANAAARRMLAGTSDKSLKGRAFSSFVMPQDMDNYFRNLRRPNVEVFELRLVGVSGQPVDVHCQASIKFDPPGKLNSWQLAFFDVSEPKRLAEALRVSREHLALATRAGGIGIWVGDLKTGKSHWNRQLYRLLGLAPRAGPEDRETFFEFIHPEDRRGVLRNGKSLLRLDSEIDLEFRIIRADDGRVRWLAAKGAIDRDETGRAIRAQGINMDITDRKLAEENMRLAQLQLEEELARSEQINQELSQYAYAVSHDLKAPLRAIRNYSDFLYEDLAGRLSGEQKQYLEGLKTAAGQGQKLIDDLLAYSRMGRTSIKSEKIDMPALINEVKAFLNLSDDVELAVPKDWPVIESDPLFVAQIMKNLVANAVKFNDNAPKRVEIGWTQAARDGRIELFVRDNGLGIDPQYQRQIFGIFQRLHTSRKFEGTGIGLAIVQKAAQELGGAVRVESAPGEGSTFYVEIPGKVG